MKETRLSQIDLPDVFAHWVQGAGPFTCFVRKTNFVSLKHYRDFALRPVATNTSRLYKYLLPHLERLEPNHLILLDIPAVEGMRLGYLLQEHLRLKPILTFVSPLHTHGLVGGDRYVNAIIAYGLLLNPVKPQGFVLILDNQRYLSTVNPNLLHRRFNNQYELTSDDLPSLEMLKALAYGRVTLYHWGEPKEDVGAYLQYLKDNLIQVEEWDIQIKGNEYGNKTKKIDEPEGTKRPD